MNRHHPYAGNYDSHRRGGSSAGPGPDRPHRFQERGGYRGRGGHRARGGAGGAGAGAGGGGYGSYDGGGMSGGYDQPSNLEAYNEYDSQATYQDTFYQSNGQYSSPSAGYNQGYGKYEDGAASGYDDDNYGRGPRRPPPHKDREEKVREAIIEERIQRERPCRTLFIRNIKYETNSDDVRRQFEEYGDIKTFFDLISTRGMVFVTYYDLRSAERARERLQGSEISGRPIDVHYSLPRDDQKGPKRERNQQFQGTLLVTLRNSLSGQPIDDNELRRKFQQFGDIKSIRPANDRMDTRYVEFYDTRACDEAFDRLRHQELQDGSMDIVFAWDNSEGPPENRLPPRDWDEGYRGRGGHRGRGRGRGRGGHTNTEWDDRRGDYGRDRDSRRGRHDDDRGGGRGGYTERYDNRGSYGGPPQSGYGGGAPSTTYGGPLSMNPPTSNTAQLPDERLEQARKVQQLLAALKQPAVPSAPPAHTATPPVAPPVPPPSSIPPYPPYPPYASSLPPSSTYTGVPPSAVPQAPPAPLPGQHPATAGLPPNIMALLQTAQQRQPTPPQSAAYGMPPPVMSGPPPPAGVPGAPAPQFQQLLSYLQTQTGKQ